MSQRRTVALVAGAATFLAATVFSTVFQLYSWMLYSFLSIAVVVAVAMVSRALRVPLWGQVPAMITGLLLMATWTFPSGHEFLGFLPSGHTFGHFHALLQEAGKDIRELAAPVPERAGLDFLVATGVGLVAIAVDVLAVGLRHPALAGLPLLAMYSVPVAIRTDSVPWIPFALGAAGYLWLLVTDSVDRVRRWGRRFTGDGRDVDVWEPSPLGASARRVGFAGLVLAVVVPLVVPGMSSGLLDKIAAYNGGAGPGDGSGRLGTSINPITTLRGSLTLDKPINLFQVRTDDPEPGYLRTAVADQITRNGFAPSPPSHARRLGLGPDRPAAQSHVPYHRYQARIRAQRLDDRYLPLFASPTAIRAPGTADWRWAPNTGVVFANRPATEGANWQVTYDNFDYSASALRRAPTLRSDDPDVRDNIEVRHVDQIAERVASLTKGRSTEYDRVKAILDFFSPSNGFEYSLETKPGSSGSAIVDFLTNRQGYCEQYASAMAWMVRQARIPARVVVGYTRGSQLGNRHVFQVTSHEAHAWVEVYFPTFGWVPFDPTPSGDVTGSVSFGWAPNPAAAAAAGAQGAGRGTGRQDPAGRNRGQDAQHGGPGLAQTAGAHPQVPANWPYWVLGAVLILALLTVPAGRRGMLRRRRRRTFRRALSGPAGGGRVSPTQSTSEDPVAAPPATVGRARRAAHAAWDELMDTVLDYRLDVAEAETPRATVERLVTSAHLESEAAASLRLLGRAEEEARYARSPHDPSGLRAASRRSHGALSARLARGRRIAAFLAPRSVLLRWRAGVVAATTGTLAAFGGWRQRLVRALVPRRLLPGRSGRS